ncbi:MAG: hypothetical protein COB49_10935 [Alphaproteobacteria bacterium]|nr:MAG: hypothetical protein COB49_10935 [Alphaproteobacteria bacterium]
MKTIFFIGHHKVGSTSLQDFLSRNSVALARSGILYPSVDFESMALMLATAMGKYIPQLEVLPINAREPHNALAFRMLAEQGKGKVPAYHKGLPSSHQMLRAIRQQIDFLAPHTVILAAEVFANFAPAAPGQITRLAEAFGDGELTVVATLRRIDDYLASWHGQRLKFGHDLAPLRAGGMQNYFGSIHFNYRLMLEGWVEAMPNARLILRDYSDVRRAGGSVADFVAQTGLDLPSGLLDEQKTNESLHRGIYEIVRRGNKALRPAQAGKLRQTLRDLTPDMNLPASGDIELFGAQNRQIMQDRFESIHAYLGKISGKSPFFEDQSEVRQTRPIPEMEVFELALDQACKHKKAFVDPEIKDFLDSLKVNSRAEI